MQTFLTQWSIRAKFLSFIDITHRTTVTVMDCQKLCEVPAASEWGRRKLIMSMCPSIVHHHFVPQELQI
jgi:hypothetical protein